MKTKLFIAAIFLLFCNSAFGQAIPFFKSPGVVDKEKWYASNGWSDGAWNYCFWKPAEITPSPGGVKLTIHSKADFTGTLNNIPAGKYACGELQTVSQQGYGLYEVRMKSAAGAGLNSAFFTYTGKPTHDEIDFEFLGKSPTTVSVNYWVNGKSASGPTIKLGFDASKDFHTYAFNWTPTSITWMIDGKKVWQTPAGAKIPANISRIYLELWAGMPGWLGKFIYTAPVSAEYSLVSFTPYVKRPLDPSQAP